MSNEVSCNKNYYVYKTTNKVNGKIYVGRRSTKRSISRDSYIGSGIMLRWAIDKHGVDNFEKEIIEVCDNYEELLERELYWIRECNSTDPSIGYNMIEASIGAGIGRSNHFYGRKHSDETKKKISEANKGNFPNDEVRKKLSDSHRLENLTEETIRKKKEAVMGEKNPFYGKKHTEETKRKISETKTGVRMSDEFKKKISVALKNRPKLECNYCSRMIGGGKGNLDKHERACKNKIYE